MKSGTLLSAYSVREFTFDCKSMDAISKSSGDYKGIDFPKTDSYRQKEGFPYVWGPWTS